MAKQSEAKHLIERTFNGAGTKHSSEERGVHMSYARFGAMILTSTVVMFGLVYPNTVALHRDRKGGSSSGPRLRRGQQSIL